MMSDETRDRLRDFICDNIGGAFMPPQPDAFRYNVCGPLAEAILDEFDVGLRQTLTPDAARAPKLSDACRCGHVFATHCTPEFPNGGHCAASDSASPGYGCSCIAFVSAAAFGSPPGMTATRLNEIADRLDRMNDAGMAACKDPLDAPQLREWAGVLAAHEETPRQ